MVERGPVFPFYRPAPCLNWLAVLCVDFVAAGSRLPSASPRGHKGPMATETGNYVRRDLTFDTQVKSIGPDGPSCPDRVAGTWHPWAVFAAFDPELNDIERVFSRQVPGFPLHLHLNRVDCRSRRERRLSAGEPPADGFTFVCDWYRCLAGPGSRNRGGSEAGLSMFRRSAICSRRPAGMRVSGLGFGFAAAGTSPGPHPSGLFQRMGSPTRLPWVWT